MSKTNQWIMEMEEDAVEMTLAEFTKRHGETAQDIWRRVNGPDDSFWDLDEPCDKIWAQAYVNLPEKDLF
jgi:hypothetical protein